MFESLIRRKSAGASQAETDAAFEFDDGFAVDRGAAPGRAARRKSGSRRCFAIGKLVDQSGQQQLIRIKNMSAGGHHGDRHAISPPSASR